MLKVLKEFPYDPIGSWSESNPFTIAMVYFKNGNSVCLKGGKREMKQYMKEESLFTSNSYVVYYNLYHKGKSRQTISVKLKSKKYSASITHNIRHFERRKKCEFGGSNTMHVKSGFRISAYLTPSSIYEQRREVFDKLVKRPPRCFPKELHPYCED